MFLILRSTCDSQTPWVIIPSCQIERPFVGFCPGSISRVIILRGSNFLVFMPLVVLLLHIFAFPFNQLQRNNKALENSFIQFRRVLQAIIACIHFYPPQKKKKNHDKHSFPMLNIRHRTTCCGQRWYCYNYRSYCSFNYPVNARQMILTGFPER